MQARTAWLLVVATLSAAAFASASFQPAAQAWTVQRYPNPFKNPEKCGGHAVSRVCDPDNLLSAEGARLVEEILKDITTAKDPFPLGRCGMEGKRVPFKVAFAVMKKFAVDSVETSDDTGESFAERLLSNWQVSDRECDNGILLLLSVEDRYVHVSSGGSRQELLLPDQVMTILNDMKPFLRRDQLDEALHQAALDIGHALAYLAYDHKDYQHQLPWGPVLVLIGIGLAILVFNRGSLDDPAYFGTYSQLPYRVHQE